MMRELNQNWTWPFVTENVERALVHVLIDVLERDVHLTSFSLSTRCD